MSTMLINISKADFGILDIENGELLAIHQAFGHSQAVCKAHYSLQTTNALTQISHTMVMLMQRVSKHWHATISQRENCTRLESQQSTGNTRVQLYDRLLGPLKTTVYNAAHQAIMSMGVEIIDELRNVDMFGHYISVNPAASIGVSKMISSPHFTVDPNLLDTLWPLFLGNPNPSFTSSYQAELVQSCLTNEHVLCVMPTGSGKSLAFFAAPLIHPHALFIVITPLMVLTEDMARWLATTRIEGGQYPHIQNVLMDQIVIVSAHQAGTDDFFHWAQSVKQRLMHVFIDKAHHVFTFEDYCNCFKLFHLITTLTKPITFLTATMTPVSSPSSPRLCLQMQIPPLLVRVIRAPLHRSNISYSIISVSTAQLKEKVIETHRLIILQEKDRGIIYCTTIALIKELSELLNILYYTSRLNDQLNNSTNSEEKNRRFNIWYDGDTPFQRWMIATCVRQGD
ncbi:hypothetical protein F4604DRAFT_1924747 [Suillus subluteus]|nr:hypothetical protein F4604DRAFT_1924747 [Suillus subluteus]